MSSDQYWHEQNKKKNSKKTTYILGVIFAVVLIVGGIYYASGTPRSSEIDQRIFNAPSQDIIRGLIDATGGEGDSIQEFSGENVKTINYAVSGRLRDDIIADILQFLTNNGWTILSGTEFSDGTGYLISASEQSKNQNLQITIGYQGSDHSVSLMYSE